MSDTTVKTVLNGKECPKCHKVVTTRFGKFAKHLVKCGVTVADDAGEPKQAKPENIPSVDLSKITNSEVRKVMERAAAVQKELQKSPEIFVGAINSDDSKTLVAAYAPECIERLDAKGRRINTHTPYFGDQRLISADISRGYEPILNEHGEFVRNNGGDILYKIPAHISKARIRRAERESESRLSRVTKDAESVKTAEGLPTALPDSIKEEAFGRVAELTFTSNEGLK